MSEHYRAFSFLCPTRLEFGVGAVQKTGGLARELGLSSVLIVSGSGPTSASEGYRSLVASLSDAGIAVDTYAAVTPDPDASQVRDCARLLTSGGHNAVVAYGGGSPMDCAKSAALCAANGKDILDFLYGKAAPGTPALPIVAVPTTAGTGSELSSAAVTTDRQAGKKLGYSHPSFFPRLAIVDPEVQASMPPAVTSATGMDALTHAVESFLSLGANPASDAINLACVRLIAGNLPKACRNGADLDARSGMALAAAMAGAAFSNTGLGMVHGFAHPVGALHGVAHGLANAIILPYVLAALRPATADRMAHLEAFFGPGPLHASVAALNRELGVPSGLASLGIAEGQLEAIAADARTYRMRPRSPRAFTDDELTTLLHAAWAGDMAAAERV
ncbi:MAG: iron-containing alcohol dehydrogenase [Spirochaetia bacterium]|nr:iron-containing alcohol dehydrogenase [Spirochaetia bacterium]